MKKFMFLALFIGIWFLFTGCGFGQIRHASKDGNTQMSWSGFSPPPSVGNTEVYAVQQPVGLTMPQGPIVPPPVGYAVPAGYYEQVIGGVMYGYVGPTCIGYWGPRGVWFGYGSWRGYRGWGGYRGGSYIRVGFRK